MAEKLSTGLRNWMAGGGSVREAFMDCVMKIYSLTPPADADVPVTGSLLCEVTVLGAVVDATERGIIEVWKATFPDSHAPGATYSLDITVDAVLTKITFTNTPDAGISDEVGKKIADTINRSNLPVFAIYSLDVSRTIFIASRITGIDLLIADGGGTVTMTPTKVYDGVRVDTLQFTKPTAGGLPKSADTWQGTNLLDGTAGYFRIVRPDDTGGSSTTAIRAQGAVSTSGAELNLSNVNLAKDAITTVKNYQFNVPAS